MGENLCDSCYGPSTKVQITQPIFRADISSVDGYFLLMKLATAPEEQRRWMAQWRAAAIALDEVRRDELANLTEEEAWRQTEDLLSCAEFYLESNDTSGLVEQQYWFHARRTK